MVGLRRVATVLCLLALLGACGEDPDALAAERCKGAVRETLGAQAKLAFPASAKAALTDDAVYGWHLDLDRQLHRRQLIHHHPHRRRFCRLSRRFSGSVDCGLGIGDCGLC